MKAFIVLALIYLSILVAVSLSLLVVAFLSRWDVSVSVVSEDELQEWRA